MIIHAKKKLFGAFLELWTGKGVKNGRVIIRVMIRVIIRVIICSRQAGPSQVRIPLRMESWGVEGCRLEVGVEVGMVVGVG